MTRLAPLALVAACAAPPATQPTGARVQASEIHVDRRIELLSIVMRLADADEYRMAPASGYVADVDAAFGAFAKHPAVEATRKLREDHGIAFDAPMTFAIHLDDQLAVHGAEALVADDQRWRGVGVADYAAQLRAFAAEAKLDAFMAAHAAHYRAVEAALRARVDAEHPIVWFDARFGRRERARYVIVPGMLEGGANYGPSVTEPDGSVAMYQVLGLGELDSRGLPVIDDEMVDTLIHEMAHSYVNPVLARHQTELANAGRALFPLVADRMREQAYGAWLTMFDESVVRAITVLYVREHRGDDAAAEAIRHEVGNGFVWTAELAGVVGKRRGNLEAALPDIRALFDRLVVDYAHGLPALSFDGPVNAVFRGSVALVTPDDPGLGRYVQAIHDQLFKAAPLLGPADPVPAGQGLVAYGAPASNPIIGRSLARFGIAIDREHVAIGSKVFRGAGLVVIACLPRADDRLHGIAIYTAASDADLVEVNSIRHGNHDWLVAQRTDHGFEVLGTGDFPRRRDGTWHLP